MIIEFQWVIIELFAEKMSCLKVISLTLNQRVGGSNPSAPTIPSNSASNWADYPSNFVLFLCSLSLAMALRAMVAFRGR